VDETLSIKENLQTAERIVIDTRTAIAKMFMPVVKMRFLHYRFAKRFFEHW
jgi:hypothetical protein